MGEQNIKAKLSPEPMISNKLAEQIDGGGVPTNWTVERVDTIFNLQHGATLSPKRRQGINSHPFLRTSNVLWGRLELSLVDWMDFSPEEAAKLVLKQGDLLVCEGGEIGRTAVWNQELSRCCYQNHIHRLRSNGTYQIIPEFYMYWMQAAFLLLNRYKGQGNKTTIANLSGSRLNSFLVPYPPFQEQYAISRTLQLVQEAKVSRQREIEIERERKTALMHYLFTYGIYGEPIKKTEIGEIPQSWDVMRLGDLCTFKTGKLNSEKACITGNYPFFTCSQETYRTDTYSFDQEAILLAGNNARGIYSVKYYKGKFDAYQRTYVITIKAPDQLSYRFLLYDLTLKLELLRRQSIGATTKFLTASIIKNLKLNLPSFQEQHEISTLLSICDLKISVLEHETHLLEEFFRLMLEELMTGRLSSKPLIEAGTI